MAHACNFQENPPVSNSFPRAACAPRDNFSIQSPLPPSLVPCPSHLLTHSPSLPISQYRLKSLCAAHTFVQSKHRRIEGANSNGYFLLHVRGRLPPLLLPQCLICSIMVHWGDIGSSRFWGDEKYTYNKTQPSRKNTHGRTRRATKKKNSPADHFISAK